MANDTSRGELTGNVDLPLVKYPIIRGTVRRSDPDGSHAAPWFSGLAGTSLNVSYGTFGGAPTNVVINFATNNYADAVTAVNVIAPGTIAWVESDGFAAIQYNGATGKDFIKITGGTAASPLGLPKDPEPGSVSYSGDLAASPPDKQQKNPGTAKLVSYDEDLTSKVINRAIVGSLLGVDGRLQDMEREIIIYRDIGITVPNLGGGVGYYGTHNDPLDDDARVSIPTLYFNGAGTLARIYSGATSGGRPIPVTTNGDEVRLVNIFYGTPPVSPPSDSSTPWTTWGTPGGSLISDLTKANTVFKIAATAITGIRGDIITATGAQFSTKKIQKGDHVIITGATNNDPFNHNGEFVVSAVIDENQILVRPLGPLERQISSVWGGTAADRPQRLNPKLGAGSYGSVAVYAGEFLRVAMMGSGATDKMFFYFNGSITAGNYTISLPVGCTLRDASQVYLDTPRPDPFVAIKNQANRFTTTQHIRTGTYNVPALNVPILSNSYTLISESARSTGEALRIYAVNAAGFGPGIAITLNCKWTTGTALWSKDVNGINASLFGVVNGQFSFYQRVSDTGWLDTEWEKTAMMDANGVNVGKTLNLGTLFTAADDGEIARLKAVGYDTDARYCLFEGTVNGSNGVASRIYWNNGVIELASNAKWDDTASQWGKDTNGINATLLRLGASGLSGFVRTSDAAWADSAWDTSPTSLLMKLNGIIELTEVASISTPAADKARIAIKDDGSGNTRLVVVFANGNEVVLATSE